MKVKVVFKTPDAADRISSRCNDPDDLDKFQELLDKYVKYGEYITVEFDTETQTVKVVEG